MSNSEFLSLTLGKNSLETVYLAIKQALRKGFFAKPTDQQCCAFMDKYQFLIFLLALFPDHHQLLYNACVEDTNSYLRNLCVAAHKAKINSHRRQRRARFQDLPNLPPGLDYLKTSWKPVDKCQPFYLELTRAFREATGIANTVSAMRLTYPMRSPQSDPSSSKKTFFQSHTMVAHNGAHYSFKEHQPDWQQVLEIHTQQYGAVKICQDGRRVLIQPKDKDDKTVAAQVGEVQVRYDEKNWLYCGYEPNDNSVCLHFEKVIHVQTQRRKLESTLRALDLGETVNQQIARAFPEFIEPQLIYDCPSERRDEAALLDEAASVDSDSELA